MPWQGQLYIGQRIHNIDEARAVLTALHRAGDDRIPERDEDDDDIGELPSLTRNVVHAGKPFTVQVEVHQTEEGGVSFPVPASEPYTDALIGFELTARYRGAILDAAFTSGGRPEPFAVDVAAVADILRQVREWWPSAEVLILTMFY